MEKEQWINDVMESANGLRKLAPREDLLQAIEVRISNISRVPARKVWIAAASVVILAGLNVAAISLAGRSVADSSAASDTPLYTNNQLY